MKNKNKAIILIVSIMFIASICLYSIFDIFLQDGGKFKEFIGTITGQSTSTGTNDSGNNNHINSDLLSSTVKMQLVALPDTETEEWSDVADNVLSSVVYIANYGTTSSSSGSGIILSSDGYIVTNNHVIEGSSRLQVILNDDTAYDAQVVGADANTDLAVIKINATGLNAAVFGDSDSLRVAESVMAVGSPGGLEFKSSVSIGYVSSKSRNMDMGEGYIVDCIQTDAAINPGNSGGALFNKYGQVVGINSSKIVAEGFEGMGFAISTSEAQPIINDLIEYGYVKDRARLGISGRLVYYGSRYNYKIGLQITSLTNESAIEKGLQVNDIITKINDVEINSVTVVNRQLQGKKPGDSITLDVYRSNSTFKVTIELCS